MFLGVDLGTSSVKAVLVDEAGVTRAEAGAPLRVSRPQPLWSEQDPLDWVAAAEKAVGSLPLDLRAAVRALGLSGQMHGATLLGDDDAPLRPAILWNDGRAHAECAELERAEPDLRAITGNKAMPGFTAPKLAWTRRHEPRVFERVRKVLLPKDYLRLAWTGDYATDVSDASGTLWLDVAQRSWSERALAATSLSIDHMPALFEGSTATGTLSASAAARLGLKRVPVAAGGGDQAAGAVGAGVIAPGDASLALGTSGVLFIVTAGFRPNPDEAAHAFCHALPKRWHQMAVLLNAASAVDWAAGVTGFVSPAAGYAAAEAAGSSGGVQFLPYLTGERTPHDDPHACGVFFGMRLDTTAAMLVHAAMEGVAFAFADGRDALARAGGQCERATVIGGGARSTYWGKILAAVLDLPLTYCAGAETGPAHGAARLARLAVTGEDPAAVCGRGAVITVIEPDDALRSRYAERLARWRELYTRTRVLMPHGADP